MTDLTINGTTTTLSGVQTFDNVNITNSGVLKVSPYDGTPTSGMLEIYATSIHVDSTSIITADLAGYRGQSSTSGCGEGDGAGCNAGWGGPGAGYGGNGGNGGNGGSGGLSYGTLGGIDIARGSGGGCSVYFSSYGTGGNGGGVISLYANDITISGTITANGGGGTSGSGQHGSGGGSGGGLLLNASSITISGHINVNGGNGSNSNSSANRGGGGGGGGGRIKIFYTATYTNTGIVSYSYGTGGSGTLVNGQNGQNGTISTVQQSATLNISSTPTGAEVWVAFPSGTSYVDKGVQTNTTLYVAQGAYDLKLTLGGYQDYILSNQTFTVGQTYNIQATLTPMPGSISISSVPTGAEIYLALQPGTPADQGIQTIPSGKTISNLTPGTYNIRLTLTGYQDWIGTAAVTSNTMASVIATFAGSAYITSTPSGAEIYLAISPNTPLDQNAYTPNTITNLTAASSGSTTIWNYKLTLSGYADTSGSFTAIAGSTTIIPVTFPGSLYITSIPTGASIYIDGILQQ